MAIDSDETFRKTRTCIFTPGNPLMKPADVSPSLNSALDGASFVYFDARYTDTAIVVAKEVQPFYLFRISIPEVIKLNSKV